MSVTPEQSAEALNGMFKFGQSLAAGFFDYLGKQNAAFQQVAPAQVPQLPLPEASDMARLQQEPSGTAPLHSSHFDFDERVLLTGVETFKRILEGASSCTKKK